MATPYSRDLVGYGSQLPYLKWLGGARLPLGFVVNYEVGGETSIFHSDDVSEGHCQN